MKTSGLFVFGLAGVGAYVAYKLSNKNVQPGELFVLGLASLLVGCVDDSDPIIDYRPSSNTAPITSGNSVRTAFCRFLEKCELQKTDPGCWSKPTGNQCDSTQAVWCVQALDAMPCKDGGLPVECVPCLKG